MPKRDATHMTGQRTRILRATIECIAEHSVEGTSIASICKQAGLSAGALYVHFHNRDEILAETIRFVSAPEGELPAGWPALRTAVLGLQDRHGLDMAVVLRARLHLQAEFVRPGAFHDLYRPLLEASLAAMTEHLRGMQTAGAIKLRAAPDQAARDMVGYVDGALWVALASGRKLAEMAPELTAGLDALVLESKPAAR